jgi:hypothetical protein
MGAGGDGIIFTESSDSNIVMKAFYKNNDGCNKAQIEYDKQLRVFKCIDCLKTCKDETVKLVNRYVRVAEPLGFHNEPVTVNDVTYDCSLKMRKLTALPLSLYEAFDPSLENRIEPAYKEQLGVLMAHLSYNSPLTGIFGVKYSSAPISRENPPRGYFANQESGFFDFLRKRAPIKLRLSDKQIESIIGFVYGWIYFACDIIPLDIEFTLGINPMTQEYEINVLDFGMTFDKRAIDTNANAFETQRFLSIYGNPTLSQVAREEELLETVMNDTGLDLYASLDEGTISRTAFLTTKNLMPCAQCRNLTFLIDITTKAFTCSLTCKKDLTQ